MRLLANRGDVRLRQVLATCLIAGALCIAIVLSYWPGLHGPFVFDDAENITANPPVALSVLNATTLADALLANDAGPLKRPLASLTFALNHFFAGDFESAFPFKVTNVAIHIVNSWLVYALVLALLGVARNTSEWSRRDRAIFAWLCAAAWALHPIQLTSVLYVVQRMTSLAGTFVLAGLLAFVYGRSRLTDDPGRATWWMTAGLVGGTLLGITAKETAVLLPGYAIAVEVSVFSRTNLPAPLRRRLISILVAGLAVPVAILAIYVFLNPAFMTDSYAARTFTPYQRILTEARVLWHYLGMLVYPLPSQFGLFHDAITPSTGLFSPLTTLPAVVGLAAGAIWALLRANRHPLVSLGILWFLVGHSLESGFIGLELAHEHRNYLPSMGPVLAAASALGFARFGQGVRSTIKLLAPLLLCLALGLGTWIRSGTWSDVVTLALTTVRYHPDSPRANDFAARVSLNQQHDLVNALRYTERGLLLRPKETGFHLDLHLLLAILADEMEPVLNQHRRDAPDEQSIVVKSAGLDYPLSATYQHRRWILEHPHSRDRVLQNLLASETLSVHAVVSLESMRQCVSNPASKCASMLDYVLAWHKLAAENPRTSRTYRAVIAAGAARLAASRGNYDVALSYIQRAASLAPNELSYHIGEVEYLTRLGRLREAIQRRTEIDQRAWPRAMLAANRASLESVDQLRRSGAPEGVSHSANPSDSGLQ
jgi:tetratricopeptide (TPR) repeat protein